MNHNGADGLRAGLERLESRENPGGWSGENFDLVPVPSLPTGWVNWANDGQQQYITSRLQAASGANSLASLGSSATQSRIWAPFRFGSEYGAGITVQSNASARLEVLARGVNLSTPTPTYVSAVVHPGGAVELVEVVNGVRQRLASIGTPQSLPVTGVWLRVQLKPAGDQLAVQLQRSDDGRYLNAAGGWQVAATEVLQAATTVRTAQGYVGVGRLTGGSGMSYLDDFVLLAPATSDRETFDTTLPNSLPPGWRQWSNDGIQRASVGTTRFNSPSAALGIFGNSPTAARAWLDSEVSNNSAVDALVFADSLIPSGVIARGSNLDSSTPSYYSLTITRGLSVQLKRTVDGNDTVLGTLSAKGYVSQKWVKLSLEAIGDQLRAVVYRPDTNEWLAADGSWQNSPESVFTVSDSSIPRGSFAGVERVRSAYGTVWIDDFEVRPVEQSTGPELKVTSSQTGIVSGLVRFTATASPPDKIARIEFRLDGVLRSVQAVSPAVWELDTKSIGNGEHVLTVRAVDLGGGSTTAEVKFTVSNSGVGEDSGPDEVRRYSHIRLAQLAYAGNPLGEYEQRLAAESLDLIVPNTRFLGTLESVAPDTPKVIYSNVSNLYGDLLTDWFEYASDNGADRETAFFHVTKPTKFSGQSAASVPVREFWKVLRGAADGTGSYTDLTRAARGSDSSGTAFGNSGQAVHLGWTDRFREVNVTLQSAAAGWAGRIEYVASVNSDGTPKTWKTLPLLINSTANFTSSGRLIFDPPTDWIPAKMRGTDQLLYYVRVVTTQGNGPTARSIFGRDYVGAAGGSTGVIPAFDAQADKNQDGYLTDAEYATRQAGMDARFVHESRLFYPYYGQMRFVTNPSGVVEQQWAADYHQRLLAQHPLADGVFLDNSNGKLPFAGTPVIESVASFTQDLASMVGAVRRGLSNKWVVSNTAGSIAEGNPIASESTAVLEEFLLRPNDHNWSNLIDIRDKVNSRLATGSYVILDTYPGGGSITTERTRMGSLAYYYLLADPDKSFLMFLGGYKPSAPWNSVFVPAATYDVGQPLGEMTTFASGSDPQNAALTYNVYGREYENALVLFKPKSYTLGRGTGTTDDATGTVHQLNGQYRQLYSDGTLGQVVTSVRVRNGEGMVLVKA